MKLFGLTLSPLMLLLIGVGVWYWYKNKKEKELGTTGSVSLPSGGLAKYSTTKGHTTVTTSPIGTGTRLIGLGTSTGGRDPHIYPIK